MEQKVCKTCGHTKDLSEFSRAARMKDGHKNVCKSCWADQMREYYANNEAARQARAKYCQDWRERLKDKVFGYYGAECACCGETERIFLTLDHVNNDGAEHRRRLGAGRNASPDSVLRELVKTHFAEAERFQILCYNCNCGKRDNGGVCPHQAK